MLWVCGTFRAFLVAIICTSTSALQPTADVKEVRTAEQLLAAIEADPMHIYITRHLDLRRLQTVSEDPRIESPTFFFPRSRLQTIVVRPNSIVFRLLLNTPSPDERMSPVESMIYLFENGLSSQHGLCAHDMVDKFCQIHKKCRSHLQLTVHTSARFTTPATCDAMM
jgi:hypothetical protein